MCLDDVILVAKCFILDHIYLHRIGISFNKSILYWDIFSYNLAWYNWESEMTELLSFLHNSDNSFLVAFYVYILVSVFINTRVQSQVDSYARLLV